ncbi:ABC transporter permease [Pusillimonas sp.]|uniref:ABC transporter permease n=1 Tax=Pusillimonas sp. TaxID=3040095 RepID=UPI0029B0A24A|nr:ABC transporter permease [Pusillimonas sp.]MDX3894017.1 ABC transporter permease [Pusillimonas sp.]
MTTFIQLLINGILEGSVYAIIALGFSLIYRISGVVNLAQGAFSIVGALVMFTCSETLGWPLLPAGLAAIAATAVMALLLGRAAFVPSLSRLPASSMLMMTAGLLSIINGILLIVWGNVPFTLPQFSGEAPMHVFGVSVVTQAFWILGACLVIIVALHYLFSHTALGNALRACAENARAAQLMGIDVDGMALFSFTLAAVVAGVGGIFFGPVTSFQYDTGTTITIYGFIAVVLGGMGTSMGAVVGGVALGIINQLAAGYMSSLFAQAVTLGLLLATLLFRPTGLFFSGTLRRMDVREGQQVYHSVRRLGVSTRIAACVICVGAALAVPAVVTDGLLRAMVIMGILFIAVIGLDVLMGYTGQVSLGQSGFMAIGGYTAGILSATYGLPPLIGIAGGLVLSLACAVALSVVTVRLSGIYLALATMSFGLLVDSLTLGLNDVTGGPSGLVGIPSISIGPFVFDSAESMYYLVLAVALCSLFVLYGGMRSGFGRALQAIRTDPIAAAALGINVRRYRMAAFCIAAGLASLSGSLYAHFFNFLAPDMVNITRSFEMVAMLVLGGEATLVGPVMGAAILTLLPTVFQPLAQYKILAEGLLLVLVFRYMPGGLYGMIVGAFGNRRREPEASGTAKLATARSGR